LRRGANLDAEAQRSARFVRGHLAGRKRHPKSTA
jgi:hypothetical protein